MATFWRRTWVPQADTPEFARLADDFEAWVAARGQENAPYDRIVRELLTMPEAIRTRGAFAPVGTRGDHRRSVRLVMGSVSVSASSERGRSPGASGFVSPWSW
jgi:hypothetical protein